METLMEVRRAMQANGWTVSFEVSALEIYNENIRDLLTDSVACDKSKLDIVMDAKTGETYVKNLSSETVSSEQDIYSLLNLAASRRETAATVHNAVSSRSHSVVQLKVLMSHKKNREKRCGRLNLIDLAGSEKVTSEHDKTQFNEAKNINKSLSSLLGCIQALASGKGHVPFRESKLTYLLQSSLSGDGKAVMFANISPRIQHLPESLNTLRFAESVNKVKLGTGKMAADK
jgi:kinesin family protein C1